MPGEDERDRQGDADDQTIDRERCQPGGLEDAQRPARSTNRCPVGAGAHAGGDRKLLFANVQVPGYVYAIRGPFKKQRC
jgi:hypothetical protein